MSTQKKEEFCKKYKSDEAQFEINTGYIYLTTAITKEKSLPPLENFYTKTTKKKNK